VCWSPYYPNFFTKKKEKKKEEGEKKEEEEAGGKTNGRISTDGYSSPRGGGKKEG